MTEPGGTSIRNVGGFLAFAGIGAAATAWSEALAGAFGHSAGAAATFTAVGAAAFALGVARGPRLLLPRAALGRGAGVRLALLGLASLAAPALASTAARALVWAGASVQAGPVATTFARALLGGLILVPAAATAGATLRILASRLGEREGPARAAALVAGGGAGLFLANVDALLWEKNHLPYVAGGLLLAAAIAIARAGGDEPAPRGVNDPDPEPGSAIAAFGIAFAFFSFSHLVFRAHRFAFANDLPGIPVDAALLATGFLLGAIAAIAVARALGPPSAVPGLPLFLVAGSGIVSLARFDAIPARFAEAVSAATRATDVLQEALSLAAPSSGSIGFFLGAATGLLAAGASPELRERSRWIARLAVAAALGASAGALFSRFALPPLEIAGTIRASALVVAIAAAGAVAWRGGFSPVRLVISGVPLALVATAALSVADPDRLALLVDRDLRSPSLPPSKMLSYWKVFDVDDALSSVAVLKRGHARRLLVNGRFEMSNESEIKSHGLLAHLPLTIHPEPESALLLGPANGIALGACLAHPIERLHVFAESRTATKATVHFGPEIRSVLRDPRITARVGDLRDLMARTRESYDVILNQAAGSWTPVSSRLVTAEMLELVRDRLTAEGLYGHWLPNQTLTKTGFQILLATVASVFPQVEVWAGQAGDTILLAKKTAAPHDFDTVLESYGRPPAAASLRKAWLEEPTILLSQFLLSDEGVRWLSRTSPIHTAGDPQLGRAEAARRRREPTINPVPGLAAIRSDVLEALVNTPPSGFVPAVRNALGARDLERRGLELELQSEQFQAATTYQSALELNPRDGAVRRSLAMLRTQMGIEYTIRQQVTAAHSNLREAVETDTTFADGFANLGVLLLQNEEFDYALSVTHQAAQLEPENELFQIQLGRIWKKRGYLDRALPYYERAMALNPLSIEAAVGYIDTKLTMESDNPDMVAALEFLRPYQELDADHSDLAFWIPRLEEAIARQRAEEGGEVAGAGGMRLDRPAGGVMLLRTTWERGLSWETYRREKIRQNAEAFDADHASPAYEREEAGALRALPPLKVVAVAEDWCPDVFHTLGTWARLAEELPGWEMRIFARDEHPDVMARYLWMREKQRIPVYAFHDEDLRPIVWWSGRGATAQGAVDEVLAGKPYSEATEAQRQELRGVFDARYRDEFRRANFREIFGVLMSVFHRSHVGSRR